MLREAIKQQGGFILGLIFGSVVSALTSYAILAEPEALAQALQLSECLQR